MKTVYVITAENPDKTRRFVAVKGSTADAIKLIEEIKEGTKVINREGTKIINVDVDYQILEKHL